MENLISRNALVTKLSKGYWNRELQQAKNDPCVIDAMIDWAIRIVKEMPLESPWHTGTPTEEGWYLQRIKSKNNISYDTDYYENGDWKYSCVSREIVAWQKIEEKENGHTYQEHGDAENLQKVHGNGNTCPLQGYGARSGNRSNEWL